MRAFICSRHRIGLRRVPHANVLAWRCWASAGRRPEEVEQNRMLTGVNLFGVFQNQGPKEQAAGEMQDYYQVLGVSKDAQTYQILTAYNNKLAEVRSASLAACVHHYCMYKCVAALSFLSCTCVGPNQCYNVWLGRR